MHDDELNISQPTPAIGQADSLTASDPIQPDRKKWYRRVRRKLEQRWLKRSLVGVVTTVALIGLALVLPAQMLAKVLPGQLLIDQGTAITRPGSAPAVRERVAISGHQVFEPEGDFLFTTVSLDLNVSVFEWIEAEINDNFELQPLAHVLGDRTPQENRNRNLGLMTRSKDNAVTAALEYLGVPINETGVGFNLVVADGPAEGLLTVGDVIVAVDGVTIGSLQSLRDELARKTPGEHGVLTVETADPFTRRDVAIVWGEHPEGVEGAYIGIGEIGPRIEDFASGINVEIDTGATGGPSAGLAFALAIIDLLTEGELTGRQPVAVTGQIFVGGAVGNVGGVAQKALAARSAGAAAFIVPKDLLDIAQTHAGNMAVFGVATLDETIEVLAELGGDTKNLRLDL